MATATDLQTYIDAAIAAMGDADYASALQYAMQAQAALVALPDTETGQGLGMRFRNNIEDLIRNINRARVSAAGVQRTKITFVALGDTSETT